MAIHRVRPGTEETIQKTALQLESMFGGYAPGNYRVLDVGGADCPLRVATHVVDLKPYGRRRVDHFRGTMPERFTEDTWYTFDVCGEWPWPDGFFDFVWCSQVVEDIRDPVRVCSEMMRVGLAGFISTVHRSYEMVAVQSDGVVGYHHHRWFVELIDEELVFTWKSPIVHVNPSMRPPYSLEWLLHLRWSEWFRVKEQFVGGDAEQRAEIVQYITRWEREKNEQKAN